MKHCPSCREEYEDRIVACANCAATLGDGPAPEPHEPDDPLRAGPDAVLIATIGDEAHGRMLEALLRAEEIPARLDLDRLEEIGPFSGGAAPRHRLFAAAEHRADAERMARSYLSRQPLQGVTFLPPEASPPAPATPTPAPLPAGSDGADLLRAAVPAMICFGVVYVVTKLLFEPSLPAPTAPEGIHLAPDEAGRSTFTALAGGILGAILGGALGVRWAKRRNRRTHVSET